jgi:hypothetical protein
MSEPPEGGRLTALKEAGRFGTLGLELLVFLAIGYGVGHAIDKHFGTRWGEPAGFAFGIFGGFYNMWKLTKKAQAALEREDRIAGRKKPKDLGNEKEP